MDKVYIIGLNQAIQNEVAMSQNTSTIIIIAVLFIAFKIFKTIRAKRLIASLESENPQYIDVRTPQEFIQSHNQKCINIPLSELVKNMNQIDKDRSAILVCLSGARSCQAVGILKNSGYTKVYNGGSWTNL